MKSFRTHAAHGVAAALLLALPASAVAQQQENEPPRRSTLATIAHTLGGALIGGYMGYVGSQVTVSSWEKSYDGQNFGKRAGWLAGGAVVGVIAVRLLGPSHTPVQLRPEIAPKRSNRLQLTREEIKESSALTMHGVLISLRPDWMIIRGIASMRESARGTITAVQRPSEDRQPTDRQLEGQITKGDATIIVYLDGVRLGGVDALKDIAPGMVSSAEFVTAQQAVVRYGGGHWHGVIQLHSLPSQ